MTATSLPSSFVKPLNDNKNTSVTNNNANEDANALENDAEPEETKDGGRKEREGPEVSTTPLHASSPS